MSLLQWSDDSSSDGLDEFLQNEKEKIIKRKASKAPFDPSDYSGERLRDKLTGAWTVTELEHLLELEKIERADNQALDMIRERIERRKGTALDDRQEGDNTWKEKI